MIPSSIDYIYEKIEEYNVFDDKIPAIFSNNKHLNQK